MKPFIIVGNWKSNKTIEEANDWIQDIAYRISQTTLPKEILIILCAPFTVLAALNEEIEKAALPIHVGAQDISPFTKGAYTGEISADMLKGLIEYVLIGHSERRKYFQEKEEELHNEVLQAHSAKFQVIYCIEEESTQIPAHVDMIAYEPPSAIGSGKAMDSKEAGMICQKIKDVHSGIPVLYGGSVTIENIASFQNEKSIDGVLVGGVSLESEKFMGLITAVASL